MKWYVTHTHNTLPTYLLVYRPTYLLPACLPSYVHADFPPFTTPTQSSADGTGRGWSKEEDQKLRAAVAAVGPRYVCIYV